MRGPKPKYSIQLIDNETTELHQLVNSRKVSHGKAKLARIILAAHEHPEWRNQQIAKAVGYSDRVVPTWRHRWVENKNLDDLPRSEAPKRFSPEVSAQAMAIACSLPKEKGRALSRWSLGEIVAQLVSVELVLNLATSTLCRWFAAEKLKPWRYHNWQHILIHRHFWSVPAPFCDCMSRPRN